MFDFDELSDEEQANQQDRPADDERLAETSNTAALPPAPEASESKASASSAGVAVSVRVRHAIQGWEVNVILPERAQFKHVKRGLAKLLLGDSKASFQGQLMRKEGEVYCPYRDKAPVGSVREVLLAGFESENARKGAEAYLGEEDISDEEEGASAKGAPVRVSAFTRENAVLLQKELRAGFQGQRFQEELKSLQQRCNRQELTHTKFLSQRQKLFLTVQSTVLPRYGFTGDAKGVYTMMADMKPYIQDAEFITLAEEINELLGIDYSPPESWGSLTDSCAKLNTASTAEGKQQKASSQRSMGKRDFRPQLGLISPVPSLFGTPLRLPDAIAEGLR
eukprot:TRINITY_DN23721_c0_g1_i1.p1 TRINITY_DN23721_c0_g1~~TRINITY_DN23721_c0_g1_i1.p1  ORF type:complete len:364 (-),score=91.51 TRINITY_DN23721_c0_g1_i1:33-1040(-)